ncbi:hypothetical protein [Promicromonospora aerolata]|uniref:Uncharacterized protein n=1 Tax=Promicromonospora aerolata TaxID=195749 RepID=A0ABW4V2R4_9MICO
MTPLQSWAFLALALFLLLCLCLSLVRLTRKVEYRNTHGQDSGVHADSHDPDEPYNHEKDGL